MTFAIGVTGVPLPSASRVQPRHLTRVFEAGARVVGLYMDEAELAASDRWAPRLRARLAGAGLRCVHLNGPRGNLVAHDEARRREAVDAVAAALPATVALGAETLMCIPFGFHPDGAWWWDRRNYEPETRRALVRSLRDLGGRAAELGVRVAFEGHQTSVLESPEVFRDVLEQAASPAVGANLDYVNYLTPPAVARFPAALDAMVEALGPWIASFHVKDVVVWPRLAVHLEEAAPGDGVLPLEPVVDAARAADVPALVEHLTPRAADRVIAHVAGLAERRP